MTNYLFNVFMYFFEKEEKDIFLLLISVSGVGASTARMMLSSMKPDDVADAMYFLLHLSPDQVAKVHAADWGDAKCPKFNVVGKEEIDNLTLAKYIASAQGKELKYELVDFNSARPGHDLRYGLNGDYMRELGWEPKIELTERIEQVVNWSLNRPEWLMK